MTALQQDATMTASHCTAQYIIGLLLHPHSLVNRTSRHGEELLRHSQASASSINARKEYSTNNSSSHKLIIVLDLIKVVMSSIKARKQAANSSVPWMKLLPKLTIDGKGG